MANITYSITYGRSSMNGGSWLSASSFTATMVSSTLPAGRTSRNRYVMQLGFWLADIDNITGMEITLTRRYKNTNGGLYYRVMQSQDDTSMKNITSGSSANSHGSISFTSSVNTQTFTLSSSAVSALKKNASNFIYFWSSSSSAITYMEISAASSGNYALSTNKVSLTYTDIPDVPQSPTVSFTSVTSSGGSYFTTGGTIVVSTIATGSSTRFTVQPSAKYSKTSGWIASTPGSKVSWSFTPTDFPFGVNLGVSVQCSNTKGSTSSANSTTTTEYKRNYSPSVTSPAPSQSYNIGGMIYIPKNCTISTSLGDSGGWGTQGLGCRLIGTLGNLQITTDWSYSTSTGQRSFVIPELNVASDGSIISISAQATDSYVTTDGQSSTFVAEIIPSISMISIGSYDTLLPFNKTIDIMLGISDADLYAGSTIYCKFTLPGSTDTQMLNLGYLQSGTNTLQYQLPSSIGAGSSVQFSAIPQNVFGTLGNEVTSATFTVNTPPSTFSLISPQSGNYVENTIYVEWSASNSSNPVEYSVYLDNSPVSTTSGTSATLSVPGSVLRGDSMSIYIVASDGLNETMTDEVYVIKNELPETDSNTHITAYNVSYNPATEEYVYTEASETLTMQCGISFQPGSSVSTSQENLLYSLSLSINGGEVLPTGVNIEIGTEDSPMILNLSDYGIAVGDVVKIYLNVVDSFGCHSNGVYTSDTYTVEAILELPSVMYGTSTVPTVSAFPGVHWILSGNNYFPVFRFSVDATNYETDVQVSIAIRRVSDGQYMTPVVTTGSTTDEVFPSSNVSAGTEVSYVYSPVTYTYPLQVGEIYWVSVKLARNNDVIMSSSNSYQFTILDKIGNIKIDSDDIAWRASDVNLLSSYAVSWGRMQGIPDTTIAQAQTGTLLSESLDTQLVAIMQQLLTASNAIKNSAPSGWILDNPNTTDTLLASISEGSTITNTPWNIILSCIEFSGRTTDEN